MSRKHIRIMLALLVFGFAALRWATTPLPSSALSSPIIIQLEPTSGDGAPRPAIARGFDPDPPLGLGLLDQQAEVLLDN